MAAKVDRAVVDIIEPVVNRSVTIACTATTELIIKVSLLCCTAVQIQLSRYWSSKFSRYCIVIVFMVLMLQVSCAGMLWV